MRRVAAKGAPPLCLCCALLAAGAALAPRALAAEYRLTPDVVLSAEYNDNVLDSALERKTDLVARVQPGAALSYRSAVLESEASYHLDYRDYSRGTRGDEIDHNLALRATAELRENFIYLELNDQLRRVSLDVNRDSTAESLSLNQGVRNIASVSPYLLWRPGAAAQLKTGYRFSDTRYWSPLGVDKREHRAFAELSQHPSARLGLSAGYSYSSVATALAGYDQHDLSAAFRYQWREASALFAGIGNSWQSFSGGRSASNLFWSVGVSHDSGPVSASAEARVQYIEDPLTSSTKQTGYRASLQRNMDHGAVGAGCSYSRDLVTQTGALRRQVSVTAFGRLDLSSRCQATLSALFDRRNGASADDFPYHLSATTALSYAFNYGVSAALSYSRVEYRRELDSTLGARLTNRAILQVSKVF